MKQHFSVLLLLTCFLAASAPVTAQDCSDSSKAQLAGTYAMYGSGYIDLSKLFPNVPGIPSAMVPMTWVGAHTLNTAGSGTGWLTFNAGGNRMDAQIVDLSYSLQPDCSVAITFWLKMKQMEITIGPFDRIGVLVKKADALEIHFILGGPPPGTPGAGLDLGTAYRISRQN